MQKVLIVDDDIDIAGLIADALEEEGISCMTAHNATDAIRAFEEADSVISLIVLDIMLPDMSGIELCSVLRKKTKCPILFLTAKSSTPDTIEGLNAGGDDYITKPFVVDELTARIKAHLRREERSNNDDIMSVGDIVINKDTMEVFLCGEKVLLSTREFQLLSFMSENSGTVLTREQIFKGVWGGEYGDIGTVAVNINGLRNKLDKNSDYIKTVWGVGYKFVNGKHNKAE